MSEDNLVFVEQWGKTEPVKWILEESDGRTASGVVADGRVIGGKYDGLSVREGLS